MASFVEAAWYFDGSGVPVGWNEGAVAFNVVLSVLALPFVLVVATGAILEDFRDSWILYGCFSLPDTNWNRKSLRGTVGGYIGMRYDIFSEMIPAIPLSAIACMRLRCHQKVSDSYCGEGHQKSADRVYLLLEA